jgi:hypothetical protein
LQGGLHEFLEGLSRLPHIDAVNATVLLVVGMQDPAGWQMGSLRGRGCSVPGEDRPSRFPWPPLVATAR